MQEIIEEVVRWIGYAALRLVSLGRYRGGGTADRLSEGAIGLGVIVGLASLTYLLNSH
jgi:hypothetical protein